MFLVYRVDYGHAGDRPGMGVRVDDAEDIDLQKIARYKVPECNLCFVPGVTGIEIAAKRVDELVGDGAGVGGGCIEPRVAVKHGEARFFTIRHEPDRSAGSEQSLAAKRAAGVIGHAGDSSCDGVAIVCIATELPAPADDLLWFVGTAERNA